MISVDFRISFSLILINSSRIFLSPSKEKCICPFFVKLLTSVLNPPLSNQNLAALDKAATTELSSVTSGTV